MKISFQRKIFPSQDKSPAISGIITGHQIMGHKTNQKLHELPYNKLYIMLEYKLKLYGIQLIKREENYTSQCSPLAPEVSKRYAEASNRKERGIYITNGVRYNALLRAYLLTRLTLYYGYD